MQGLTSKNSAMAIHGWLYRLLSLRGLRSPDQRPLFKYQLSADEYSELLNLLREAPQKGNVANNVAYCGAFCLFCAEWYRREYQVKDGWSWDSLWKRLGYELSAQELAKIIPKGLEQFWQRPIRFYESDRRNFLGSLFSEGGLAFKVLTDPNSRFQALFDRVLKRYEASQLMTGSIETVVRSQVEQLKLPQVFREQTSIELIVQMADQLAQLVDLYKLEGSQQPVEVLDRSYPQWRESFPIPLDDQTGRGFLNGLLKTASKEARKAKHSGQKLSCEHYWLPESGNLEVKITLPIELTLDVDIQPVSNRFDLSIHEGKNLLASIGPGYARVSHSLIEVRVRHQNLVCRRKDPSKALFVVASIGGQAVASKEIPASVLDLGTVPVGFEARDDSNRWRCVGQNSFRTEAEELVLLVPALSQLSSDDCTLVSQTSSHSETNQWLVSGKGQVKCEQEDVFSIRLGDTLASHSQVKLKGHLLQYPTRPSNTYIGLPQAVPEQSAGLEHERLQVFVGGGAVESCHLNQRLGSQRLAVKSSAGETLLRRKVGVLPADFSIEIQPGTQPSQGYVRFRSSLSCFIEWMTEGVKARRLPAADVIEYELTSEQEFPPGQIAVRVCPNLEADPIEIDLPFPTVGVVALNEHDQPLPKRLSVDELLGTRLYLFARPDCSVKYRIDMRLPKSSASRAAYIWHYLAKPEQPVEISLYEMRSKIESLLSLEEGIDQQVQLSISGYGKNVEYTIQRHALTLNWDKARNLLYRSTLLSGDERTLCPVLMLLHEPERKPLEIPSRRSEGVATGEFEIPALVEKNGPWLVLPQKDSLVSFRPVFIAGEFDQPAPNAEIQSLQRAVQAFHPSSPSVFTPVLQQMVSNPGHSGWQFVQSLYKNYGYLSLATFEVWKALVNNPDALMMSLYKFSFDPEYTRHLERDFPLIWETVPLNVIKKVSECYWGWMLNQGLPDELVNEHLKPDFNKKLLTCMPMLGANALKWIEEDSFPPEIKLPDSIMHGMINDRTNDKSWYQGLLRNHGDDASWPDDFGNQLKEWAQIQSVDLLGFEPENDFRNAVVYLPIFLAAVAAGQESIESLFLDPAEAAFHIRQIRDFDPEWFSSVYQYALLKFIFRSQKESAS